MTEPHLPSETYDIGEIAILAYSRYGRVEGPVECMITGRLQPRLNNRTREYEIGYAANVNGMEYIALPAQLRKKRPPREDLQVARWDECPWQPESIHV